MANNHIDVNVDKNSQCDAITTTGMNTTQIAETKKNYAKELNIDEQISKFKEQLKNDILQILVR